MRMWSWSWILVCGPVCAASVTPSFQPNRGQAPAGEFVAHSRGYSVALSGAKLELQAGKNRVAATLTGTRQGVKGEGENRLPGTTGYWLGRDTSRWINGVPMFARVRYRNVYPGIDAVYYFGKEGQLEYDFEVAPGADPRQIGVRYSGAKVALTADGELAAEAGGAFRQHRPVVYQEVNGAHRPVEARYAMRGGIARIVLGAYDRERPLVIDPPITWATFVGVANSAESVNSVAVDASGNIYTVGLAATAYGYNLLLTKLDPTGATILNQQYIGGTESAYTQDGSAYDVGYAVAVDSSGNIYLAGETASYDFPADASFVTYSTNQYYVPANGDAFLMKVNAAVTAITYSHLIGGTGEDIVNAIALDSAANVYLAGTTSSLAFPTTTGAAHTANAGGYDAFVARFNASGGRVYATLLGGSGSDSANAIAVDSASNAYVSGQTASSNFPTTAGVFQTALSGTSDAFVAKIAPASGTVAYVTLLGGSGDDFANGIAIDASGAAYVTGETLSADFPVKNAAQPKFGGGAGDIFVTKLNPTGQGLSYSTYLGGSAEDGANAIALDQGGNVYLGGSTLSPDFPLQDPFQKTFQGTANATPNAVVAALSADGASVVFSSYLGGTSANGSSGDSAYSLALNCTSGLIAAGATASSDFPVTAGTSGASYYGGGGNGFVAKIAAGLGVPSIAANGVVKGATFANAPMAPGSLISIFGSNLSLNTQGAASTPLPVSLAGTSVAVGTVAAPIVYASSGQLNVQLPYEVQAGTATATVAGACGPSPGMDFTVAQAAPYLFQNSAGDAIVQNQDFSINSASNPAAAGTTVTVYLTGIGPLDNPVATGAVAPTSPLSRATLTNSAKIGSATVTPLFLGLAPGFVGLAQANITIPAVSSGKNALTITVGGTESPAANIYVK